MKERHAISDAQVLDRLTTLLQEKKEARQRETKFKSDCKKKLTDMQMRTKEYIDILEDKISKAENKALLKPEKQDLAKSRMKVSRRRVD